MAHTVHKIIKIFFLLIVSPKYKYLAVQCVQRTFFSIDFLQNSLVQLTREIKLCYGWTRCGQQFVCAVRLSHILTSFSAKYAPLIVRAALISASCGRKGWANQWWALTHSRLLIGKQEHLKRFYELIRKPIKYFNQIKSVCAPPLVEFCKLVFIVPHRRHSWLFPTPHFPRQLPAIQTDDNDFLYFGLVVWLLIQSVKSLPLKWWLLQIASIK